MVLEVARIPCPLQNRNRCPLGTLALPASLLEGTVTFTRNAKYFVGQFWQYAARATVQNTWGGKLNDGLNATASLGMAVLAVVPIANMAAPSVGRLAQFVGQKLEGGVAARLNPLNYSVAGEANSLGMNAGNIRVQFKGTPIRTTASPGEYGVYFFGKDIKPALDNPAATLGRPGHSHFFMPTSDASKIKTASDAALNSGMARSVTKAYNKNEPVYGVVFPTKGLRIRAPTATDAGGFPHFLEGGKTAAKLPGLLDYRYRRVCCSWWKSNAKRKRSF